MENDQEKQSNLQDALSELSHINRIIDRICRLRETNHIMSIIIEELIALTGASQGVINLIAPEMNKEMVTVTRRHDSRPDEVPYKVHTQLSGWVIQNRLTLKIDDLDSDDRFRGISSEQGKIKSVLCFPMMARGEIIGLVTLVREEVTGPFSDAQSRLAGIIVSQSAQILSNAFLLEELARKNQLLELSERKLHAENVRLKSELKADFAFENVIGKSEPMRRVLALASRVCGGDSPILITGPTGAGKEVLARAIHYNGGRRERPFVVKNCGIKTESLLEAELFGYVKGAFTGADRDRAGLFREADGGTVFLDEVGDAPLSTQVAILRVIDTGEIRPVGAGRTEKVNVRVISATNRDLKEEISKGNFREDLYYRLNAFAIDLPPLSRRREDIPLLVHHITRKLKIKLGKEELSITPAALEAMQQYDWPGNIRQLENEIERAAVISGDDGIIDRGDLSSEIFSAAISKPFEPPAAGGLKEVVEKVERDIITATLARNKGNILKTSKVLGLTRKGLKDKMTRYGLSADRDE